MWIHEDVEAIFSCCSQNGNCVIYPLLVILLWPLMLYSLPSKDISDCIVAQSLQASEVDVGIFQSKWALMKVDIITVEEVCGDVGWNIWRARVFGISSHVDSTDCHLSSMRVLEVAILNSESQRHGGGVCKVFECIFWVYYKWR